MRIFILRIEVSSNKHLGNMYEASSVFFEIWFPDSGEKMAVLCLAKVLV